MVFYFTLPDAPTNRLCHCQTHVIVVVAVMLEVADMDVVGLSTISSLTALYFNISLNLDIIPTPIEIYLLIHARGYIPKVFSFKTLYPLNPKKSDLFYFLLIRTKQPKLPKLQRAVSSSSALHAMQIYPPPHHTTII